VKIILVANKRIARRCTQSCGCQHIPPDAYWYSVYALTESVRQETCGPTSAHMFSDPRDREETMAIRTVSLSPITIPVNHNENAVTE